jgi:hypothetical protein
MSGSSRIPSPTIAQQRRREEDLRRPECQQFLRDREARFRKEQRQTGEWINVGDIIDWARDKALFGSGWHSGMPTEVAKTILHDLRTGEFGRSVILLNPEIPGYKLVTAEWVNNWPPLDIEYGYDGYFKFMWIRRSACRECFARHEFPIFDNIPCFAPRAAPPVPSSSVTEPAPLPAAPVLRPPSPPVEAAEPVLPEHIPGVEDKYIGVIHALTKKFRSDPDMTGPTAQNFAQDWCHRIGVRLSKRAFRQSNSSCCANPCRSACSQGWAQTKTENLIKRPEYLNADAEK